MTDLTNQPVSTGPSRPKKLLTIIGVKSKIIQKELAESIAILLIGWLAGFVWVWWVEDSIVPGIIYALGFFAIWYKVITLKNAGIIGTAGFGVGILQRTNEEKPDLSKRMLDALDWVLVKLVMGVQVIWAMLMLPLVFFINPGEEKAYFAFVLACNFAWMFPIWYVNWKTKTILWILTLGVMAVSAWHFIPDSMRGLAFHPRNGEPLYMMEVIKDADGKIVEKLPRDDFSTDDCRTGWWLWKEPHVGYDYSVAGTCFSRRTGQRLIPIDEKTVRMHSLPTPSIGAAMQMIRSAEASPITNSSGGNTPARVIGTAPVVLRNNLGYLGPESMAKTGTVKAGSVISFEVPRGHCPYSLQWDSFVPTHDENMFHWELRPMDGDTYIRLWAVQVETTIENGQRLEDGSLADWTCE